MLPSLTLSCVVFLTRNQTKAATSICSVHSMYMDMLMTRNIEFSQDLLSKPSSPLRYTSDDLLRIHLLPHRALTNEIHHGILASG